MIFKKLVLQNIRSYEDLEIEFPRGSLLLAGDIGSGKTSILLGLQFALFGLQPGQKGASILRQGKDEAYARLELDIDGEIVNLERKIKKSKAGSITQESNIITIGKRREEISTSEMKDRVVSLLNYPKEFVKKSNLLYKFTVYTPQEEMKAIIQERPEVRLDTLRHIFGIDRYKRIKENTDLFLQKLNEEIKIKNVLVGELNLLKEKFVLENEKKITLAREVNNLSLDVSNLKKIRDETEKEMTSKQENLDKKWDLDSELKRLEVELRGKQDMESRLKKEIILMQRQSSEEVDFSEERLRSVTDLYEKHKNLLEDLREKFLRINSDISVLESRRESPIKIREDVSSIENCPTCHQKVEHTHKEKIFKKTEYEILDIDRELEVKIQDRNRLEEDLEKEQELIRGYESDRFHLQQNKVKYFHLKDIKTKIQSDSFILDRVTNEIIILRKKMEEISAKILLFSKVQEDFDLAKRTFQESNEVYRKKEILSATKNKELEILSSNLESLKEEIKTKEKLKDQVNHLRSLEDWIIERFIKMIDLTEKNVMVKLRSEFSKIFSEWFSMLVSENLSVRLDEEFTPIITNQDYEIDYEFLSGGERTATALAYRLALNQVLNSMLSNIKTKDIVILDEPTDGFASEQIDKMRDIFDQLKAEQIILVSHEQKIEGFVDNIIKIKKENSSRIEQKM